MKSPFLLLTVLLLVNIELLAQDQPKYPAFLNPDIPLEKRIEALLSSMTLEEKIGQLVHEAPATPRLPVAYYQSVDQLPPFEDYDKDFTKLAPLSKN